MTDCYSFHQGISPLLVSVPHDGRELPESIAATMTAAGKALPDTDWHVAHLYEFAKEIGASMIVANYSRYVVDLNRPADDASMYEGQRSTGLCPLQTFDGRDLYSGDESIDIEDRLARHWHPYHDKVRHVLDASRDIHGHALLWDAHSIASRMPTLFEGELPVLNIGTYDGRSCATSLSDAVLSVAQESPYDVVFNARFKGGHTTRHYGRPAQNIHAIQLELAQRAYMDEQTREYEDEKASQLRDTLRGMLTAFTMPA
jgi:N-formylglutamate amidohydrolase